MRETGHMDGKMRGALWWITAVTAAASIWVIFRVLLGFGDGRYEGGELSLLTVAVPLGSAALLRRDSARRSAPPAFLDDASPYVRQVAAEGDAFEVALLPLVWGFAAGAAITVLTATPDMRLVAATVAVIVGLIAAFITADGRRDRAESERLRRYVTRVRGHGERSVGEVVGVDFTGEWNYGYPRLRVTARFAAPSGARTVTGDLRTEPAAAPILEGTVLVWHLGDGDRSEILLEPDPDSIRDPGAAARYAPPSGS